MVSKLLKEGRKETFSQHLFCHRNIKNLPAFGPHPSSLPEGIGTSSLTDEEAEVGLRAQTTQPLAEESSFEPGPVTPSLALSIMPQLFL